MPCPVETVENDGGKKKFTGPVASPEQDLTLLNTMARKPIIGSSHTGSCSWDRFSQLALFSYFYR